MLFWAGPARPGPRSSSSSFVRCQGRAERWRLCIAPNVAQAGVSLEAVSSDETQTNDPLTLHGPTTKTMPPTNTLGLSGEIVAGDMLKTLEEKQRLADPVRVDAASRC
jgi:hypothetical protein